MRRPRPVNGAVLPTAETSSRSDYGSQGRIRRAAGLESAASPQNPKPRKPRNHAAKRGIREPDPRTVADSLRTESRKPLIRGVLYR